MGEGVEALGALITFPERMHSVQTRILLGTPFTSALTRWRFGYQRLLVLLWAWLTLKPVLGPFLQISHVRAIISLSILDNSVPKDTV